MATRKKINTSEEELKRKARLFAIAGDETRIKILCCLFQDGDPCVSEISEFIDASVANTSHHLQIMHKEGLLKTERRGNNVCYKLVDSDFTKELKKLICDINIKN
ncbi:MAG: metalloregulator ArsR/SmtB family transcription factor [Candidatus Spechtbacterales bacterium]|nr:metalloregulator ArsR/SmtB family transcription factor [Candidatus Spechtbacterales bacterium]